MKSYEWTLEEIQDGEIIDSSFLDTLSFDKAYLAGNDLGLVLNIGNENTGVSERYWAYVKDGKLPEYFTNENGESIGYKVPVKFHNELKKYFA